MKYDKIYQMQFSKIYTALLNKALKKGRSQEEVNQVIDWLTGYDDAAIRDALNHSVTYGDFFLNAPCLNPKREQIKGTICGVRIETIDEPLMKEIRYLDKLIDDLAKSKPLDKIIF